MALRYGFASWTRASTDSVTSRQLTSPAVVARTTSVALQLQRGPSGVAVMAGMLPVRGRTEGPGPWSERDTQARCGI